MTNSKRPPWDDTRVMDTSAQDPAPAKCDAVPTKTTTTTTVAKTTNAGTTLSTVPEPVSTRSRLPTEPAPISPTTATATAHPTDSVHVNSAGRMGTSAIVLSMVAGFAALLLA